jgi:hypothetical protein
MKLVNQNLAEKYLAQIVVIRPQCDKHAENSITKSTLKLREQ